MNVRIPAAMGELWDLLDDQPEAVLCAGGTDVMVKIRAGAVRPGTLVCLDKLRELRGTRDEEKSVFIGACTTHTELLSHGVIRAYVPLLAQAAHVLGSPPIRNMATLGGNICTASPAGDTLPALYVLDAEVALQSRQGRRRIPIDQFILGPGRIALQQGEIVEGVVISKPTGNGVTHFEKVGQRKALSISIASLAALLDVGPGAAIRSIALAWGSVGPTIVRSRATEEALIGQRLTIENLRRVFPLVREAVSPINDLRAGADYRKNISCNLLLRLCQYGEHVS